MRAAIEETERRRAIQQAYNEEHHITPTTIKKAVRDLITISQAAEPVTNKVTKDLESMDRQELEKLVKELTKKMNQAAAELNFEEAVVLRDRMVEVKKMLLDLENHLEQIRKKSLLKLMKHLLILKFHIRRKIEMEKLKFLYLIKNILV